MKEKERILSIEFSRLVKALNTPAVEVPCSLEELISQTVWYKNDSWNRRTTSYIEYLGEKFYLTGSRWFLDGARYEKTDYDFFTLYSEEMIKHLESVGFERLCVGNQEYIDKDCLAVLRKEESIHFPQIDVQLVQYPAHRVVLRNLLKTLGYEFWSNVNKETASQLWSIGHSMGLLPSPLSANESFPALNPHVD